MKVKPPAVKLVCSQAEVMLFIACPSISFALHSCWQLHQTVAVIAHFYLVYAVSKAVSNDDIPAMSGIVCHGAATT